MKHTLFIILLLIVGTTQAQVAEKAEDISPLLIGETIPNELLIDSKNQETSIIKVIGEKPTVMVLYRGGWCPYCNAQLSELAKAEAEILSLGYQIVAVSPESFENIAPTIKADSLNYRIFSDTKANFIQKLGVAFKLPEGYKEYISTKSKGQITEILPVPTVLILNTKGTILFEYINVDYKTRISKDLLIAVLKTIKQS